jgi:chromosome segregation ATPase
MSRIGQHISALREDARSINRRIAELKQFIHQYQINAMKTNLQDEHVMYMGFITDYTTELNDLKSQLDDIAETIKKQEQKLDD